jgi:hypothetical protein
MKVCNVEGCDRQNRITRGMCWAHYMRWLSRGDPGPAEIGAYGRTGCQVSGCGRKHFTHGFCKLHFGRWKSNGDPLVIGGRGATHHLWAGGNVGYGGLHDRLRRTRGSASAHACQHCAQPAEEWAYDHTDPQEHWDRGQNLPYSTDFSRYIPLCKSCHGTFDWAHRRAVI